MADKNLNINVSVRTQNTTRKLQQVNKELRNVSRSANVASASAKRMGGGFRSSFSQLSAFTGGMIALGSAFRVFSYGVKQMVEFEKTMSTVKAVSKATEQQFASLTGIARKLGATTSFSASEAADGLKFLSMAGFSVKESMLSLEPTLQLAKAGAMDLGRAADIVSNIMRAMNMEAKRTGEAGDIIAQAARNSNTSIEQLGDAFKYAGGIAGNLGLTLEETTAALSTLSNAGMQASMAGTGLRQVLTKLVNPSTSMREVFESVGIKVDELDISAGNLVPTLRKLQQAGLTTGEIFKAFEARAGTAFSILMGGIGDLEKLEAKNKEANGTLQEMSDIMANNLATSGKLLQSAFSELFISQNEFHSGLRNVVDTMTMALNIFNGTAESVDRWGNSTAETAVNANKLIFALKAIGVVLGAIAFRGTVRAIVGLGASMKGLFFTTVTTTKAIGAQAVVVNTTHRTALTSMIVGFYKSIAGMITFKGATVATSMALRGLAIAIASTGIGAIVVAIGFVIGKLISWASQSEATKDQAIGDTNAMTQEIQGLKDAYSELEKSASKTGTEMETSLSRTHSRIAELANRTVPNFTQALKDAKPPEITNITDLESDEQVLESIRGIQEGIVKQRKALNQLTFGDDDEDIKKGKQNLEFLEKQLDVYKKQGTNIVFVVQQERERAKILQEAEKQMKAISREVESFAKEMRQVENAAISAQIDVRQAEARFKSDLTKITTNVGELAGRKGGSVLANAIQREVSKGDITKIANITGMLKVGIEGGELEGAEKILPKFEENVQKTRAGLLKLAGGAEGASRQVKKAVTQLAILQEMQGVKSGGSGIFEFIKADIKDAGGDIKAFEASIKKLRDIEDLQATIKFNDVSKNPLATLEANIAKAKLEIMSLNAELEVSSTTALKSGNALKVVGNVLNQLGLENGMDTSTVDSFTIRGLDGFKDQVDDEIGLHSERIAEASRAVSTIERLAKTRQALTKTFGEGADDFAQGGSFKTAGEALRESIRNGSNDAEDIIGLALLNGVASSEHAFRELIKTADAEELDQIFKTLALSAEAIRQQTTKQGMAQDELVEASIELGDLDRQRTQELEKQHTQLEKQKQTIADIQAEGKIKEMEANLAMGAGGVTQADIDLAKEIKEGEAQIERFARKLKNAIEKSTEIEVAIKRTELNKDDTKDATQKKKELADYEANLRAISNAEYEALIEKQKRIFQQVKFAEQVDKAIKSFAEELDKFKKEREGRQDQANEFIQNALGKAEEKEGGDKGGDREAGVSSLAKIGGGGGVGRGAGTKKDVQVDIRNINEEMLRVLNEIAKDEFGVANFKELDIKDQKGLLAGAGRIKELVDQKKAGGIGLDADEGKKALKNIGALLAQEDQDADLAEVANLQNLANIGQAEMRAEAPKAINNDQVEKLVNDFKKFDAKNQIIAIKKLEAEDADKGIINLLKSEASKAPQFQDAGVQDQFNALKGGMVGGLHDLPEQKRRADTIFETIRDKNENPMEGIDPDEIRSVFEGMIGNMDQGAEMLADRLANELDFHDANKILAEERVNNALDKAKGSDLALGLDELPDLGEMGDLKEEAIKEGAIEEPNIDDPIKLPPLPDIQDENFQDELGKIPPLPEGLDDVPADLFPPLPPLADMPEGVEQGNGARFQLPDPSELTEENRASKTEVGTSETVDTSEPKSIPTLMPPPPLPPPPAGMFEGEVTTPPPIPTGSESVVGGDDRINETNRLLTKISGQLAQQQNVSSGTNLITGTEL